MLAVTKAAYATVHLCGACGRKVQGHWRYCPACGESIEWSAEDTDEPTTNEGE